MRKISLLALLMLILPVSGYGDINPYNVDYAVIKITQKIKFYVKGADEIEVFSYIPQEDFFQKIITLESDQNFTIVKDEFGNKMLKFTPTKNEITIKTTVKISRRKSVASNISFPFQSNLTFLNSKFPLIFGYGEEFQKFGKITQWIYTNLEYDEKYGDKILSADEVFVKRKGVCDEYATLFISFLRKLGYSASYEVGYAFDGDEFRAHGWVRIYATEITDIDPTWCEMPVDALHIKFASLPDPVFNETKIIAKGDNPEVKIYPQEIEFEIVEYREKPVINTNFRLIDKKVNSNSYALGKITLSSNECIITTMNLGECVDENGNAIVKPYIYPKCIFFCEYAEYFSVFSVSKIDYPAKCNLSVSVNLGNKSEDELEIDGKNTKKAWLSVEKDKVRKGEKVKVQSNGHIFTIDGKYAFKEGEFKIYENTTIYALYGTLEKREIAVTENIPFEAFIENVTVENNTTMISISLKNLLKRKIRILLESDIDKVSAVLLPEETRIINITSEKITPAQIRISYEDFSIILSKYIKIEKEYKGDIFTLFQKIIRQIIEFLSSLI